MLITLGREDLCRHVNAPTLDVEWSMLKEGVQGVVEKANRVEPGCCIFWGPVTDEERKRKIHKVIYPEEQQQTQNHPPPTRFWNDLPKSDSQEMCEHENVRALCPLCKER